MVFETMSAPGADVGDVERLFRLVLKRKDQELVERRVELLEVRAKQAEEARGVLGSELSVEEQNRRLREILK